MKRFRSAPNDCSPRRALKGITKVCRGSSSKSMSVNSKDVFEKTIRLASTGMSRGSM